MEVASHLHRTLTGEYVPPRSARSRTLADSVAPLAGSTRRARTKDGIGGFMGFS